jgi:DEAD/DEAH box helicase
LLPVVSSLFAPQFCATPQDREQLGLRSAEELGDLVEGVRTPNVVYNQVDDRGCLPKVIVLAPTRELASQIHVEAKKLCHNSDVKAVVVYGGAEIRAQLTELATGCDIIVATPGRLNDLVDRKVVSFSQVSFLVLDEADRMLDMGFEVRTNISSLSILKSWSKMGKCIFTTLYTRF